MDEGLFSSLGLLLARLWALQRQCSAKRRQTRREEQPGIQSNKAIHNERSEDWGRKQVDGKKINEIYLNEINAAWRNQTSAAPRRATTAAVSSSTHSSSLLPPKRDEELEWSWRREGALLCRNSMKDFHLNCWRCCGGRKEMKPIPFTPFIKENGMEWFHFSSFISLPFPSICLVWLGALRS